VNAIKPRMEVENDSHSTTKLSNHEGHEGF
jgi:hypothetical protein